MFISTGSATAGLPGIGSHTDKQSATITLTAASLDGTVAEGIKAANHSIQTVFNLCFNESYCIDFIITGNIIMSVAATV